MPSWITSLVFAVLVVTIPFTLILKMMLALPKALALSHRRWPMPLNFALIGLITLYVMIFIRSVYYGRNLVPAAVLLQFGIAGVAYVFGLVLLLRQFSGLYPEYIITSGPAGLSVRKTVYRKIKDVHQDPPQHGEVRVRIETEDGLDLFLNLPSRDVSTLFERLRCG